MNANGASSFRLEAHFLQWRHHPPRARPAHARIVAAARALSFWGFGRRLKWRPPAGPAYRCARASLRLEASARAHRADVLLLFNTAPIHRCKRARSRGGGATSEPKLSLASTHTHTHTRTRRRNPTGACVRVCLYYLPPWSDVRLPAELKHITKRRRRKQP